MHGAGNDRTRNLFAYLFMVGFFAVVFFVLWHGVDVDMKELALVLMGGLMARMDTIVNFLFGSSHGSEKKTDMLNQGGSYAPTPASAAPGPGLDAHQP